MKKFFHEAAIKKLLAYKRKYPDNPAKCAIKNLRILCRLGCEIYSSKKSFQEG